MQNLNIVALQDMTIAELGKMAKSFGLNGYSGLRKQDIISLIVDAKATRNDGLMFGGGVLEVLPEGYGFLRSHRYNYLQSNDDIYVSHSQVRKFDLRTGHTVEGQIRPPKKTGDKEEHYYALLKVEKINGEPPQNSKDRILFDNLTPIYPHEQLRLEHDPKEFATRIVDLMCPIGKGQRGTIVAPPYSGKTTLLKNIAQGLASNHPDVLLMVLLIDERPEEVTDVSRVVNGEVVSSTFDEHPERHVAVVDMVIEKAKRWVEYGQDVVILLDSMTRFARACNLVVPTSGKTLTGGLDSLAFVKPRKFFGSARKIEEGGSLTIIATALIDTESRADDAIFEEFKGTGNMEVHLERSLLDRSIFPTINISLSKTRREEALMKPDVLRKVWVLRKFLGQMGVAESMELLSEQLDKNPTNEDLLEMLTTSDPTKSESGSKNSAHRWR
ncbi:MAG: transcription termination factor Rho [Candidatus Poribacteria bacterium]|nr:transcription termination factor Rho [Candidatus Poribacteria bacterium]